MLSASQQDYIEIIYRLELAHGRGNVRISDIAKELGTKLPTVTRTVQKLTGMGVLDHAARQEVSLTETGRQIGAEILHRHEDLVRFFTAILGLSVSQAQADTCQIEHGISGRTAQRLHEFLEYYDSLSDKEQKPFAEFLSSVSDTKKDFNHLPSTKADGWRM